MNSDSETLIEQWRIHRKNLDDLEIRKAKYGLDAPISLLRQIEDEKFALAGLEQRLQELKQPSNVVNRQIAETKPSRVEVVKILFLAADPTDASRLRLGKEFAEIGEHLQLAEKRDQFKLELPQLSLRPENIIGSLLNAQPQIVHFSGHGTPEGSLCFENKMGQIFFVQPDALAAMFEQFATQINCVLLNACYSEIQARAIAKHIEYVIGMSQVFGDKAAIAFAIGFYQALGAGRPIEDAYKFGCVQIRLQGIPEHLTPVLIKKTAIQPWSAAQHRVAADAAALRGAAEHDR